MKTYQRLTHHKYWLSKYTILPKLSLSLEKQLFIYHHAYLFNKNMIFKWYFRIMNTVAMETTGGAEVEVTAQQVQGMEVGDGQVGEGGNEGGIQQDSVGSGKDVIHDGKVDELTTSVSEGKLDDKWEYYVVAPFIMPTCIWEDETEKIIWLGFPELSLVEVVDKIKELLKRDIPTCILVLCWQKYVHNVNEDTLEKYITEVSKLAMDSIHKLGHTTVYYVPQWERVWNKTTSVNLKIRVCNLDAGLPPCNLHKKMLVSVNKGRVFYIRTNLFAEYLNGTGVGETLSYAGLARVKDTVKTYCKLGFVDMERPPSKIVPGDVEPPPLFLTRGYKDKPEMMEFIRQSGLRQPSRPHSLNRRNQGQAQLQGQRTRSVSSAGRMEPPRAQVARGRTKVKPNTNVEWTSEDDLTEGEIRTREFLERKKKIDRKVYGPDAEELASRLKDLRLQGVQERKGSQNKVRALERQVKELREDCNEKERKLREQRLRLREYRDSERRIRDLKSDIRDKDDTIRRLRNDRDMAEAESALWQDAYEKISDAVDGKSDGKRRRK